MPSSTKYAKSGDVHIAYQVVGAGELDLVIAPGFISHVEHQQKEPVVAQTISRSLSGTLCVRHSMTPRSIYAEQDEDEECRNSGQVGGAAVDPEGAD
jgi:hypothetical protein